MKRGGEPFPDYPFEPKRIEIRDGIALSYLDEGPRDGDVRHL